jgi:hypothetical protein
MRLLLLLLATLVAVNTALAQKLPPGGYQNRLPSCMDKPSLPWPEIPVSLRLRNAPLLHAIKCLAMTIDFKYRFEQERVVLWPQEHPGQTRLISIPQDRVRFMIQRMEAKQGSRPVRLQETDEHIDMKPEPNQDLFTRLRPVLLA